MDNFLKRSIQESKTIYVNTEEPGVKFFKAQERVKCYNRIEKNEEFESADEEFDVRPHDQEAAGSSERLLLP